VVGFRGWVHPGHKYSLTASLWPHTSMATDISSRVSGSILRLPWMQLLVLSCLVRPACPAPAPLHLHNISLPVVGGGGHPYVGISVGYSSLVQDFFRCIRWYYSYSWTGTWTPGNLERGARSGVFSTFFCCRLRVVLLGRAWAYPVAHVRL
jgi:hypothetical protein